MRGPLAAALLAAVALTGCRGGDEPAPRAEQKPSAPTRRIDPATVGVIEGAVSFSGSVPENRELSIAEPACAKMHPEPPHQDLILVADGKLANAFVWIKEGLAGYGFDPPTAEVTIDQSGCVYRPLVVGVQVGQPLTFTNSDPVLHNIHTVPKENRGANFAMATRGMRTTKKFDEPEVMIMTKCDVHPWMRAYIGVVEHPFFAVTGADGAFRLEGVPPGEYVLELWHEKLGRKTQKVTVPASGTARADFSLTSS